MAKSSWRASAQVQAPVFFDRIRRNNGIRHLFTAPYSPTITEVARVDRTMRDDLLSEPGHSRMRPENFGRRYIPSTFGSQI
jgi:hypothetical protein